jgi:hypothetical protein
MARVFYGWQAMTNPYHPVKFEIKDDYIWITLQDGRIVAAPLNWYDWLEQATPAQQAQYQLGSFSIVFPELEDGIDVEALLIGAPQVNQ